MITKLLTAVFDFLLQTSTLAEGARAQAPRYLSQVEAQHHATAAKMAESTKVTADLLLAMAFVESRYIPTATSRLEHGVRTTGIPKWSSPPDHVSGPYFCGVTQVMAGLSWKKCLELRNIAIAYRTAVHELEKWLKVCRNDINCALAGYGGGFPAIRAGTSTYPTRVLSRARAIRRPVT